MSTWNEEFTKLGEQAKTASKEISLLSTADKNQVLQRMATYLRDHSARILAANDEDMQTAAHNDVPTVMLDRLRLTSERIEQMAVGVEQLMGLPDPVGHVLECQERPNGLLIEKLAVPLGVVAIIYEARPNVTVDAAALCFKAGNATILRGGKEAFHTNEALVDILQTAIKDCGYDPLAVQLVRILDRAAVYDLLQLRQYIDVVIPRGGAGLIQRVVQDSAIPVIETGSGICHLYVHEDADVTMALDILYNGKVQRPSVCNSLETLLVHERIVPTFLPLVQERLGAAGVSFYGVPGTETYLNLLGVADDDHFNTEYNDLLMNVRIVSDVDTAIDHIARFTTHHSEAIVTANPDVARHFMAHIDAAAVYHNASTRFTDGFEFGFGAEIGISTQKLHARGPMGLPALTTYTYHIYGTGQVR